MASNDKLNGKQAILRGFKVLGFREDQGRSRRYRVFFDPCVESPLMGDHLFLVGRSGALRLVKGLRTSLAVSRSITDSAFAITLREFGRGGWSAPDGDPGLRRAFREMLNATVESLRSAPVRPLQ